MSASRVGNRASVASNPRPWGSSSTRVELNTRNKLYPSLGRKSALVGNFSLPQRFGIAYEIKLSVYCRKSYLLAATAYAAISSFWLLLPKPRRRAMKTRLQRLVVLSQLTHNKIALDHSFADPLAPIPGSPSF